MRHIEKLRQAKECPLYQQTATQYYAGLVKLFAPAEEILNVPCSDVHKIFCEWCENNGYEAPGNKLLGYALRDAYGIFSKPRRVHGSVMAFYVQM